MRCIAKGAECVLVALLFVGQTHGAHEGQNPRRSAASSGPFFAFAPGPRFTVEVGMMEPDERRGPKDPGYQSYREGYRLILEEQWAEARKKLSEVLQKTARSGYADDASFWIAYSWKYSDRAKAVAAYKKFMREYPESNYADDALAELERLGERTPQLAPHDPGIPTGSLEKIVQLQQRIAEEQARVARFAAPPAVAVPMKPPKAVEATIRLKIETLQALSRLPHDEQSFRTLKEIALDPGQATELRQAGLEGLVATQRQEGVEVFTRVLQSKSDVRLRMTALHGLRSTGTKGDPALYALVKTIALDKNEPFELRDATLHLLAEERRPDFPRDSRDNSPFRAGTAAPAVGDLLCRKGPGSKSPKSGGRDAPETVARPDAGGGGARIGALWSAADENGGQCAPASGGRGERSGRTCPAGSRAVNWRTTGRIISSDLAYPGGGLLLMQHSPGRFVSRLWRVFLL